jgi:ribosomal protein S8
MKNSVEKIRHFLELLVCAGAIVSLNPIAIGVAVIPTLVVASKVVDDISGNKVKDSIFSVYSDGRIYQNSTAHPLKMLSIARDENKAKRFEEEALTMFTQLNNTNKKGEEMTYKTKSQPMTLFLLRMLQKNGYITNLESKKAEKKRLFFEKLFMGNLKDINKKTQMYNISFNLTDKERNKEELINIFSGKKKDNAQTEEYQKVVKQEEVKKENSISREKLIELKNYLATEKEFIKNNNYEDKQVVNKGR